MATVAMSLGDALGRLSAPATAAPFDDLRLAMVDTLLAASARGALTHAEWESAFGTAVHGVAHRLADEGVACLQAAAKHSRYRSRDLARRLPDAEYRDRQEHRLLAAGMPLERLASLPADPQGQQLRGVALESAWDEVMRLAGEEAERFRGSAIEVREWRRPTAALWTGSAVALAVVLVMASWLGGVLPAPDWFDPLAKAFWSVGWW